MSSYVTYALSTLSVILLNITLAGTISLVISALTVAKLGWDLWDKWQSKRNKTQP